MNRNKLDPEEQALWQRVIATVKPLHGKRPINTVELGKIEEPKGRHSRESGYPSPKPAVGRARPVMDTRFRGNDGQASKSQGNLDSHWDRRFKKGAISPDVSIDLHGSGLAGAYARLDGALEQAVHHNLRVILLVTGKARGHDRASGEGRGAIASVVRDWLAASRHASHIAAVRGAHPRHGGSGALYIILKA
ncbi:MAG: Smr/MutS family protein [Sphingorhabdus sp.]